MSYNDKKEKEKISLENFNYESKGQRLTSPFSLKACGLQGKIKINGIESK